MKFVLLEHMHEILEQLLSRFFLNFGKPDPLGRCWIGCDIFKIPLRSYDTDTERMNNLGRKVFCTDSYTFVLFLCISPNFIFYFKMNH